MRIGVSSTTEVSDLDAFNRKHLALANRLGERSVILLVQVGVRGREVGDGTVERVAGPEIGGDRDPVARARVRSCERPRTGHSVVGEPARQYRLEVERRLPVAELTHVDVVLRAIEVTPAVNPAE